MARVLIDDVNKIYNGTVPLKKAWYEVWKPSSKKADVHVVKGVNIDIKDGEFLVLVGASGCGKTTTLRMVAGLEDITSGKVYIGETLVNDLSPKDRDIAMVFQSYALYPHMNVFDNMAFGLRLRKMSDSEIQQRVGEAADLLKLQTLLHRKPKELSGGQRQRVAMGRAIVRRPKVYLMDEPLSNLDAKLRVQMRAELQKLHRTLGVTTIYVTHDQTEAMTLGDRIVVMHNGIIQQNDNPLNIYDRPANQYVAGFIGSPPMNFMPATVVKGEDEKLWIQASGFKVQAADAHQALLGPYVDKGVTIGVRAEDIFDRKFARNPRPEHTIQATVDVLEPLGSEVYLYLSVGDGDNLVARVDAHTSAKLGEKVDLVLNMVNLHIFDKETEACITSAVEKRGRGERSVTQSERWESQDGPSNASEAMRDRYVERSLEKLLRYQKEPRNRPADLIIMGLLVTCLAVLLLRPAHTDTAAIQDLSGRVDRLMAQQQGLEQALRESHKPAKTPAVAHTAPPVAASPVAATPVQPTAVAAEQVHLLEAGESLWAVCQKYYGDAQLLPALAQYNGIADTSAMHVGQAIKIPPADKLRTLPASTPKAQDPHR